MGGRGTGGDGHTRATHRTTRHFRSTSRCVCSLAVHVPRLSRVPGPLVLTLRSFHIQVGCRRRAAAARSVRRRGGLPGPAVAVRAVEERALPPPAAHAPPPLLWNTRCGLPPPPAQPCLPTSSAREDKAVVVSLVLRTRGALSEYSAHNTDLPPPSWALYAPPTCRRAARRRRQRVRFASAPGARPR